MAAAPPWPQSCLERGHGAMPILDNLVAPQPGEGSLHTSACYGIDRVGDCVAPLKGFVGCDTTFMF
jgi:hypothetical protein